MGGTWVGGEVAREHVPVASVTHPVPWKFQEARVGCVMATVEDM